MVNHGTPPFVGQSNTHQLQHALALLSARHADHGVLADQFRAALSRRIDTTSGPAKGRAEKAKPFA